MSDTTETTPLRNQDVLGAVRDIAKRELSPLVVAIDREGHYPEGVLRAFGAAGAFAASGAGLAEAHAGRGLRTAIEAMSVVSEYCLSTAFCMWCQNALGWYIALSDNSGLRDELGPAVARGETLGGTGLSNPMKAFFGIERIKLKAQRVRGGYKVKGVLPWISNLGPDHRFGVVFELNDMPEHRVMAVINCAGEGVKTVQNDHFVALEGTRTFSVQLRDSFISDDDVLADPIDYYIPRIRAGFILLQSGMAFGLIRNCIQLMKQERTNLGLVNKYIEKQPEDFDASLASLEDQVWALCETPFETGQSYFRRVVEARLAAGEATVRAAHYAMLHQGAKGYLSTGAAQRRLRESYFVAIVTPAIKQLRKMLADMPV
jgi:alkylation response protein AidB-like acyl-CoA dehydrogenase